MPITRFGVAAAVSALAFAGCTSDAEPGGQSSGSGKLVIATDLPLQGAGAGVSESTNNMIRLYLDQQDGKAGDFEVELVEYDNSTAEKGAWDNATCAKNAQAHVTSANEVAVMGTYDSGCAKILVPVLNMDPNGPMLMVSHANTNPGLTKEWDPGEPQIFYPAGDRNYARVVTTDDYQGAAAAQFMSDELKVKKCFVLNDGQTYGRGVAKAFAEEAGEQGITIVGDEAWDPEDGDYEALFEQIKKREPDCLYVGGIFANNGGQLIKDKVAVLGDNDEVALMAPDGFSGYEELQDLAEAEGMYLSIAGLDLATLTEDGLGAELAEAYEEAFEEPPASANALYGVAAVQVILEAIEDSDGTRQGVRDAVFEGDGITIPAGESAIGKEIRISAKSGDVNNRDITVLRIADGEEKVETAWPE